MGDLKFTDLDETIRGGFPHPERARLQSAYKNLRFSQGRYHEFMQRDGEKTIAHSDTFDHMKAPPAESYPGYEHGPCRRSSPIFRRVLEVLTGNLYKAPVGRHLASPEATEWLNRVYQRNAMGPRWQRADQLTVIGGFSAFQFAGDEDPDSPVKVHLWGPNEVVVWADPDDQTRPRAVATIDMVDGQRRLALWTEEYVAYYETKRGGPYPADGGTAYQFKSKKANPYRLPKSADDQGRGILPFAFAHFEFPTQEFETCSPGDGLTELNEAFNFGLDDLGDGVRYLGKPIGLAKGVDITWESPKVIKPGMFLNLPASNLDAAGNGTDPTLEFASAPLEFVEVTWADLNNYLDHSLEMHGVPPNTIRMTANAASGIAILAEQAPLLQWAEKRRRPFSLYEERAAVTCLQVGASHLRAHGRDAAALDEAAREAKLALTWPRMYVQLPGPEQRLADDWRVYRGFASKVDVLMEQEDLTEEQAIEKLRRVAEQNRKLQSLGIDPAVPDPGAKPANPFDESQGMPPGAPVPGA